MREPKIKRRRMRYLVLGRDNEQTVCVADSKHEVHVCE